MPSNPQGPQPFPCGGPNQPACPPKPAGLGSAFSDLYTREEMLTHGHACYQKGRADASTPIPGPNFATVILLVGTYSPDGKPEHTVSPHAVPVRVFMGDVHGELAEFIKNYKASGEWSSWTLQIYTAVVN